MLVKSQISESVIVATNFFQRFTQFVFNKPVENATATASKVYTNIDFENIKESWDVNDKCYQNGREDIHKDSARVSLYFSKVRVKFIQIKVSSAA